MLTSGSRSDMLLDYGLISDKSIASGSRSDKLIASGSRSDKLPTSGHITVKKGLLLCEKYNTRIIFICL